MFRLPRKLNLLIYNKLLLHVEHFFSTIDYVVFNLSKFSEFNVKIFVGIEYECPCGHRFMCSSPDKILKASGSGLVRDNGSKVTNCDMPLYFPCPCR